METAEVSEVGTGTSRSTGTRLLTPMVGLGLGELEGLESPDILVEPMLPTAPLQFFYLRNDLVQNILIDDHAQWIATVTGVVE